MTDLGEFGGCWLLAARMRQKNPKSSYLFVGGEGHVDTEEQFSFFLSPLLFVPLYPIVLVKRQGVSAAQVI